tara:strand:- start:5281 stop:6297 length:1017 start_codon:yes stop_codon:yes gene_type:complete
MVRKYQITFLFIIGLSLSTLDVVAQAKRAQTSMKFLSVSPSANAAAMSNAVTALELGSSSVFYNPAAIANSQSKYDFSGGVVQYIADINYNSASFTFRPSNRTFGVIGFNVLSVDYGSILSTVVDGSVPIGYRDVDAVNPSGVAIGVAYANAITEQFSVGANFRYVTQKLGSINMNTDGAGGYLSESFSASTGVLDFGVLYKTGFESLNFAMVVQNFSKEISFDDESAELPMTFKIGLAMDVIDLTKLDGNTHSLLVSIDARRPRDYDEQLVLGLDYGFLNRFNIRGGYAIPSEDEESISFGGGITQPLGKINLSVDYAYTEFGVFGNVNRISFRLDF